MIRNFEELNERIEELNQRLSKLKKLAVQLGSDARRLGTPLDRKDSPATDVALVASARDCKVPILSPLTIGTMLASVLGEIDAVENAQRGIARNQRPGEETHAIGPKH